MIADEDFSMVTDTLSALVESLNRCKRQALRPGSIGQSAFFGPTGIQLEGDSAELFIKAISDWDVMDDADNGNVPRYPALVEADADLLDSVEQFNASKLAFKAAVAGMQAANDKERQRRLRDVLKRQGLARAHPLQCWREVRVFRSSTVKTVGFTTTKKSFSSKVMTPLQAITELEKREAYDVIGEMAVNTTYQTVRWINPVSPFIRVNLSFWGEDGSLENTTFHASLPILIEKGAWPTKLKFNKPKENNQGRKIAEAGVSLVALRFRKDAYLELS
jgi:hypothetical protein